jgi:uncharacterized membrane protein YgcG
MKKALLGAAVAIGTMVFAAPAFAQTGYVEICKSSTGLAGTPSFTYTVSNGGGTVVVPNNSCSSPIAVTPGNVTVTETLAPFFKVASITTSPGNALASGAGVPSPNPNLTTGTVVATVPAASDSSGAVVLNYTNAPVTGYIEVCKNNETDSGLTGNFTFTVTGSNAFLTTVSVPIGHCSLPILVPAGSVTVAEQAPNSVTRITIQEPGGGPLTTITGASTATVPVQPSPAAGDTSKEAIVTFYNETVQLKICKIAADSGVTALYTFTAVASDPTLGTVTRTVAVLPGQCQLVPGPYTNPNGTTGWRAGTKVSISEGVVPGTAVTGIAVVPTSADVGPKVLSPLPNPTLPGPAGSDVVVLAAGETQVSFTNASEPGGTLKVCENADPKAPASAVETFTVSSPTPAGSTTTAAVPFGSCTIVPNPVTSDGLWLYNSTVTIAQNASTFPFVSVAVSPTARLLTPPGATISVAIGSGDTTIATYTNDPPGDGGSSGGGGSAGGGSSGGGSAGGSVTLGGASVIAAVSGTTAAGGSTAATAHTQLRSARLIKIHGHLYLVVRVASTSKSATIRIVELNNRGQKVRSFTATIATNRNVRLAIPLSRQVRVADVKLA